ncbi:hypothetical protein JOD57_003609 [Geodermatophilus bullaregiensis]|uniref:hypothetical protein n=1 Tax=Geodermatophilus bullaregiensis TaxID=1564160 RepID=UPI00195DB6B8|nr:hypothetical protein [Geodermatophilus bullaregiensis]MBM7807772.1 hypothetical protein [Geodermatophilus bullaregiensis]
MAGQEAERLLMAQLLGKALTNLRAGIGWHKPDEGWLKPFPEALRSFLGVDTAAPPAQQRAKLAAAIERGLNRLPEADRELIDWAWNRSEYDGTEKWSDRRVNHRTIRGYKSVERAVGASIKKLVAAMMPLPEPPLEAAPGQAPSAKNELYRVWAYRKDWSQKRLDVSIYVEPNRVIVRETRDIAARHDGVERFSVRRSYYWAGTAVQVDVAEGAELEQAFEPNTQAVLLLIRVPPTARGDRRRFVVTYETQDMAPVYSSGWLEFDAFTARLQFRNIRPKTVWLIEHFPPKMFTTENIRPVLETYAEPVTDEVDAVCYYEHTFEPSDFTDEGVAWELPDTPWRGGGRSDQANQAPPRPSRCRTDPTQGTTYRPNGSPAPIP